MSSVRQPHILFVLDHFFPYIGGGETLFFELTRGLVKKGHKVTVVTSRYDAQLAQEEMMDGVRVLRTGGSRISFQWMGFRKASQIIRSEKVDLIHATTFFGIIPGWLLQKVSGIKTVLTVHEVYGKLRFQFLGMAGIINYLYEYICMNMLRFSQYVCVSNYTKNCLRVTYGITDERLKTVYNGIEYEFWDPKKVDQEHIRNNKEKHHLNDSYIGLYFGRMGVAKGMNDVLQALPEIVKTIPNYKQVFITPKKQAQTILGLKNSFSLEEIQQYIDDNKLNEHIVRIESVPRTSLRDRIALADVTILPSRAEGFGFAVSEVCALGGNLITTNVASIPEVVYGKVSFVEPGNAADIAEKLIAFHVGKHELIAEKKFLWSDCVEGMVKLYVKLTTDK